MKTKRSSIAVMSPPRLAGDRKPSTAKTIVMTAIEVVCERVGVGVGGEVHRASGWDWDARDCLEEGVLIGVCFVAGTGRARLREFMRAGGVNFQCCRPSSKKQPLRGLYLAVARGRGALGLTCTPVPTSTLSIIGFCGGRKTSP